MFADAAWFVLHETGHNEGAAVSFEAALGGLVALLVVVGALWYLGVFESLAETDVDERDVEPGTRD